MNSQSCDLTDTYLYRYESDESNDSVSSDVTIQWINHFDYENDSIDNITSNNEYEENNNKSDNASILITNNELYYEYSSYSSDDSFAGLSDNTSKIKIKNRMNLSVQNTKKNCEMLLETFENKNTLKCDNIDNHNHIDYLEGDSGYESVIIHDNIDNDPIYKGENPLFPEIEGINKLLQKHYIQNLQNELLIYNFDLGLAPSQRPIQEKKTDIDEQLWEKTNIICNTIDINDENDNENNNYNNDCIDMDDIWEMTGVALNIH
eukprot:490730_1